MPLSVNLIIRTALEDYLESIHRLQKLRSPEGYNKYSLNISNTYDNGFLDDPKSCVTTGNLWFLDFVYTRTDHSVAVASDNVLHCCELEAVHAVRLNTENITKMTSK